MAGLRIRLTNRFVTTAAVVLVLGGLAMNAARMQAQGQGKLAAAAPVTYDNRFELFGGLNYMNFYAEPNETKEMNLGGGEGSLTYWLSDRWGAVVDLRGDAGTSPVNANPVFDGRALVVLYTGMGGVQYRVKQNQRAAFSLHAYAGGSHGDFNITLPQSESGLYQNETKPIEVFGGAVDLNRSKNLAIRLSPELIEEQFGPGSRSFVSISGGVVWRLGRR